MAERRGSWWDSWYNAAKNKSVEVLEFVKRDLDEFSTAVKSEASSVVTTTTSALKEKLKLDEPESTANTVKRSVSSFLGQVGNALNPLPQDDDDDDEAIVIFNAEPVPMTKFQAKLHSLILDPSTFLNEPEEKYIQQYHAWLDIIEDQLSNQRLSKLMSASPDLHNQYTKLVPEQVSHADFWHRYLFRKALLEDEEAHREAMERRAEREKKAAENFQWDPEENFGANIDISEEEQIRLLEEYEKECATKKIKQSASEDLSLSCNLKDNYYSSVIDCDSEIQKPNLEKDLIPSQQDELLQVENKESEVEMKIKEKKDMVIVSGDGNSCHTLSSCSGDKESNDDDWEKEFDLEDSEVNSVIEQQVSEHS